MPEHHETKPTFPQKLKKTITAECHILAESHMYKNSLLYRGGSLWNKLPDHIKESPNFETFKMNYRQMRHVLDS